MFPFDYGMTTLKIAGGHTKSVTDKFTNRTPSPRHHTLWVFFRSEFLKMFPVLRMVSEIIMKIIFPVQISEVEHIENHDHLGNFYL